MRVKKSSKLCLGSHISPAGARLLSQKTRPRQARWMLLPNFVPLGQAPMAAIQHPIAMTTKQIDYLNIGLMLLTTTLAFVWPLEQLFFANLLLAPVHYLTELAWLERRNFFVERRRDIVVLFVIGGFWFVSFVLIQLKNYPAAHEWYQGLRGYFFFPLLDLIRISNASFMFMAFVYAFCLVIKDLRWQLVVIASFALVSLLAEPIVLFLGVVLGSVIHTYFFTGAFILSGALKNRSVPGLVSVGIFLLCGLSFMASEFFPQQFSGLDFYWQRNMGNASTVRLVVDNLVGALYTGEAPLTDELLTTSQLGVAVVRFLSFMYAYHYLNWFSKTTVIKWHQIDRRATVVVPLGHGVSAQLPLVCGHSPGLAQVFCPPKRWLGCWPAFLPWAV